jgi:hypothetical protein
MVIIIDGVAATDPVPESEHVVDIDSERGDPLGVGRNGDEVPGYRVRSEFSDQPTASSLGVADRLGGCECLGGNHEQRRGGINLSERAVQIGRVHVRNEPGIQAWLHVGGKGATGHIRPEVAAADADVYHRCNSLAGRSGPDSRADSVSERSHAVENFVDIGGDVLTVHYKWFGPKSAECHMQHRSIFGAVDVAAFDECRRLLGQTRRVSQVDEAGERALVDEMLREVDGEVARLKCEALGSSLVGPKQLGKRERLHRMGGQGPPRRSLGDRRRGC